MIKLIADGFNDVNLWKSFGWLVLSRFGWFLLVWAGFDWFDCGGLGSIQLILAHFPGYGKPFIYCSNR